MKGLFFKVWYEIFKKCCICYNLFISRLIQQSLFGLSLDQLLFFPFHFSAVSKIYPNPTSPLKGKNTLALWGASLSLAEAKCLVFQMTLLEQFRLQSLSPNPAVLLQQTPAVWDQLSQVRILLSLSRGWSFWELKKRIMLIWHLENLTHTLLFIFFYS